MIGDTGATFIAIALQSNTSLKSLIATSLLFAKCTTYPIDNDIRESGAEHIAQALLVNTSLKLLDLARVLLFSSPFT